MILTVDVKKNEFWGDRFYFAGIIDGFAWVKGKKFIGIVEEKDRLHISADSKCEAIQFLLKIKNGLGRVTSSYFLDDLIKKVKEQPCN